MRKYKKVNLYKIGRYQEDFEYIFPKIKIEKYITDKKMETYNNRECIYIKDLSSKIKNLIVVCDKKNDKIKKIFDSLNLKEFKNYMFLEDFAKILDEKLSLKAKIINYVYKKAKKQNFDMNCISNSEMFKKMIYSDVKCDFKCYQPFNYVQIQQYGFVFPCCSGWINGNIGNILYDNPKKVWNSTKAKIYRLSIINKTYAFCIHENCPYLTDKIKVKKRFENLKESEIPKTVCLAFDSSCNLKCSSCRNHYINKNNKKIHSYINGQITKKLVKSGWLNDSEELIMASNGEVFFSDAYKDILFSNKINKRNSITIHTNGTLINKKVLEKLCDKYSNIDFFISLDACTEETYKELRGGNFNVLKRNLEYISQAKKEGKINSVSILYVLQKSNYKELVDTVKLAIELNFDRFDVTKINNWGTFSVEEFKDISMYDENGNPKKEMLKVLNDPIFDSKDIEFFGNVLKEKIINKFSRK